MIVKYSKAYKEKIISILTLYSSKPCVYPAGSLYIYNMDSPRSKVSAEILHSFRNARSLKRDFERMMDGNTSIDQENSMQVDSNSSTCQLDNCLVCEKNTPFWLLTRNPTWYAQSLSLHHKAYFLTYEYAGPRS